MYKLCSKLVCLLIQVNVMSKQEDTSLLQNLLFPVNYGFVMYGLRRKLVCLFFLARRC
jgi:hypothetical protein